MKKRVIIGISGASGVIYGIKLLEALKDKEIETHLIISEAGKANMAIETSYKPEDVTAMADYAYSNKNIGAVVASGSFLTDAMVIAPCSIKTLSGIAHSFNDNLMIRAADVILKEKRKLVLLVRETPLHKGHLRLMLDAADLGAHILPPIPSFYHMPTTIEDIIMQTIGKVLDYLAVPHHLFQRWQGIDLSEQ